jgi:hypothetical protein
MADNNGEWTLVALNKAMIDDLDKCQSESERINCRAICEREIKNKAVEITKTRKLTPGEMSVLLSI